MSENDIDDLKKERTTARSRFTKIHKRLMEGITEGLPPQTNRARYKLFLDFWGVVQEKQEACFILMEEDEDDNWSAKSFQDFKEAQSAFEKYSEEFEKESEGDEIANVREKTEIAKAESRRKQESTRFESICDQLTNLMSVSKEEARHSVEAVKEFTRKLEDSKLKLDDLCNNIIEASINEGQNVEEATYTTISENEKTFNILLREAKVFVDKHPTSKNIQKNTAGEVQKSNIRFERIKFELFNGEIRKYACFKKEFETHIKPHHPANEEAFILKSYLAPDVKEDVATLGEDAKEIWNRLDQKYGDEGRLVDSIMNEVKNIPFCDDEDPKSTLLMIKVIERAHRDLKYLGMEQEISNSTIVSIIEKRLPDEIEREWLKIVTGGNTTERIAIGRDKFPSLLKLLQTFKARIEYKFSDLRCDDNQSGNVSHADNSGNSKKPWCWMHPNAKDHPIWRCKEFAEKNVSERIELVRNNKACLACLEQGHQRRKCPRNFKCRESNCGKPHHTMIHVEDETAFSLHGLSTQGNRKTEMNTLLLLQEIKAERNGQQKEKIKLNCLWDSGSTISFITFAMANKLNLRGSRVNLSVTKIGGATERTVSFRYNITLVDQHNVKVQNVTVLGLEAISSQIKEIRIDNLVEQFHSVRAEDVRRPTSGDVDILLR